MTEFNIGDRVEMVEKQSKHTGKRGVVVGFSNWGGHATYTDLKIQFDDKPKNELVAFPPEYFKKIEYRFGDEVTVRATVQRDNVNLDKTVLCRFHSPLSLGGTSFCFSVSEEDIVTHTPKPQPIQVGDIVRAGKNPRHHEVIGLYNEQAWIRAIDPESDSCYTTYINNLERI